MGDKGAEGNHTRRDDSPVFNDARGQDLPEDSNVISVQCFIFT